jgi:thioredoxin 1
MVSKKTTRGNETLFYRRITIMTAPRPRLIFAATLLFAALCQPLMGRAQTPAQGVSFFNGSWSQLLATAKVTGKPFYVDVYTDWCGPCKVMDKNTFRNPKVGAYSQQHFLAYKLNAEKGEGVGLAREHRVNAYPTVLFFDANGKLIGRNVGLLGPDDFMAFLAGYADKTAKTKTDSGQKNMTPVSPEDRAKLSKLFKSGR